jgi:hypothetical protein
MPVTPVAKPHLAKVLRLKPLTITLALFAAGIVGAAALGLFDIVTASAAAALLVAGIGIYTLKILVRRSRLLSAISPALYYSEAEAITGEAACTGEDVTKVAEKVAEAVEKLDFARNSFVSVLAKRNPANTPPVLLAISAPEGLSALREAFEALKTVSGEDSSLSNIVIGVNRLLTGCDRYDNAIDVLKDMTVLTQALILYLRKLKEAGGKRVTLTLLNKDYKGLRLVGASGLVNKVYTFEVE